MQYTALVGVMTALVRHIVGAIANEGDISSRYVVTMQSCSHLTPHHRAAEGMPGEMLQHFTRTRILNKPMNACGCWVMLFRTRAANVAAVVVASVANS